MNKKQFITLFIFFIFVVSFRLFFGVYRNDEFGGNHLFMKHRPTWHFYFYSPTGQSDLSTSQLSKDEQEEQAYWDEFVVGQFDIE